MASRAQKYERKDRVLYALVFKGEWAGRVYIGQTVQPKRRMQQHRRAWVEPFEFVELGWIGATQNVAEDFEYAWRLRASLAGYKVIAQGWDGDAFVVNDTYTRMTDDRWAIADRLRWPRELRMRKPWAWVRNWLIWQTVGLVGCWVLLRLPTG